MQYQSTVFALEKPDDINTLYPLYISNHKNREFEIDLLYLEKDGSSSEPVSPNSRRRSKGTTHYCLIKNLESLFSNNGNKVYICRNCMSCFTTSEAFRNHQEICLQHDYCKVKTSTGKTLKFIKAHFKSRLPVVIYADFESMNIKLHTVKSSDSQSYSIPISKQEVISFGMYIKSDYNNLITTQYHTFTGYDAKEKFVETIIKIYNNISQKLYYYSNANKRVRLTHTQQQDFNQATHCYICNKEFNNKKRIKIREHNHFNGKYRGAACQSCNTNEGKASKIIPVFFHNGSGYDFHFIITELMKYENQYDKVDILAKNSEEYISITYGNFYRKLVFLDSYRFLQKGLADVAKSLDPKDFKITEKYFSDCKFSSLERTKSEQSSQLMLIKQKGVYPYEYITSLEILNETQLPPIEAFYSTLKGESITKKEYEHAQNVWNAFDCKTLLDYHNLYLKADVLILSDAFEKFRDFFLTNHQIDPAYCYSAPGLTWQCGFKYTDIELDLLSDYEMLLMFENGIRGGYSGVLGKQYVKANNKYIKDYDFKKPSNYFLYLDANNLYGWAMSQPLPTGDFKWEDPDNYDWRNCTAGYAEPLTPYHNNRGELFSAGVRGCIVECDLEYPSNAKFKTSKFPLAPEKLKINESDLSEYQKRCLTVEGKKVGNVLKLILNLKDKKKYIIHYQLLKYYEYLGLRVKKIHRIISFKQEPWLKKYIDFNTNERMKANSEFEKNLWKLMNNSFYGKPMENIRGRVSVNLQSTKQEARKMFSKPTYKDHIIFNEDLTAVLNNVSSVKFDKPIYLGMCVLDYSKLLMYMFYYEVLNKTWPDNEINGFDTDSFFLNIYTEDIYEDMKKIIEHLDTSNYEKDNPLFSNNNKKVIGKFKDELGGKIITEVVYIRSKGYVFKFKIDDNSSELLKCNESDLTESGEAKNEIKKLKGITKSTVKHDIKFQDFKDAITEPYEKVFYKKMYVLNSEKHEMFVKEINKKAISPFDDKRWISINGIDTYPHGYDKLVFL